jgi:uncharacterized protein
VTVYFADTSAIIKHYTPEPGSAWMTDLIAASGNTIVLAEITLAEVGAAMAAKARASASLSFLQRDRDLSRFLQDCNDIYGLIALTRPIIDIAVALTQKHRLRGYDAVQLATALNLANTLQIQHLPDPIFATADADLIRAATAERLAAENPNDY